MKAIPPPNPSTKAVPTHAINRYIREWLVIGPFPRALDTDFLTDHGGETGITLYEGMTVTAPDGQRRRWTRYESTDDVINLLDAVGEYENVVAYAACTLISETNQRVEMCLGSDDGVKVWLNGAQIHAHPHHRPLLRDEDRVPVNLRKGENRCLIKVDQISQNWEFAVRWLDEAGYRQSIEGISLSVRRQKPSELEDTLSITVQRVPESPVWQSVSMPVQIEVKDENAKRLAVWERDTNDAVEWRVPDDLAGMVQIVAKTVEDSARTFEAEFSCRSHSTVPIEPQLGHWETIDQTNGLNCQHVYAIRQDRRGLIWFGGDDGLYRYDGRTFRKFTTQDGLPGAPACTIFEDSRGNLWFGTREDWSFQGAGVCRYDGETFHTYTTKDGLVGDGLTAIYEDEGGNLWFGTTSGVSRYNGEVFQNYTTADGLGDNLISGIVQDQNGDFWFSHGVTGWGAGNGVSQYDGNVFTHLTRRDGLIHRTVQAMTIDSQGVLWFATSGGVSRYDGRQFENFTTDDGLPHDSVMDVEQTANGDMWFTTINGVSRYRDGKFHNFTTKDGLAHDVTCCIADDREGNLWFGTWGGGVSRYDASVTRIPIAQHGSLSFESEPIRDTIGYLWFGIHGTSGVGRYDGQYLRVFAAEDGISMDIFSAMFQDSQQYIWIGGACLPPFERVDWRQLAKYDGETFQIFSVRDGLSGTVEVVCEDREDVLWFGTQDGGVSIYNGEGFVQIADVKTISRAISDIIEDRHGTIWMASREVGCADTTGSDSIGKPPNTASRTTPVPNSSKTVTATSG